MLADGGLANHRKQPGLQAGLAAKTRFAFKDLQIDRLQNFFGFGPVTAATIQGPAETSAVERFQFSLKLRYVHYSSVYSHGYRSVFEVLVARAGELYDSDAENVLRTSAGRGFCSLLCDFRFHFAPLRDPKPVRIVSRKGAKTQLGRRKEKPKRIPMFVELAVEQLSA
jgi:hypothetical protein